MWQAYIDWIDRDLGTGWPSMNGWSSLVPFVPITLAIIYALLVHPDDKPSFVELIVVVVPMVVLFAIWGWRVYLAAMRQVAAIRNGEANKDE